MASDRSESEVRDRIAQYNRWYHRIELYPGVFTPGINDTQMNVQILERLGLPQDVSGKRVLDIGAADGFYSFLLERRGAAEVVAVDYRNSTTNGFQIAADLLGSRVQYHVDNVYNLSRDKYGEFDVILFLGVLYHLRNPLLAFDRLRDLAHAGTSLFVETHLIDNNLQLANGQTAPLHQIAAPLEPVPLWQFFPRASLNEDATNKWSPNMAGLRAVVEEASFEVMSSEVYGSRGFLHASAADDAQLAYFRQLDSGTGW